MTDFETPWVQPEAPWAASEETRWEQTESTEAPWTATEQETWEGLVDPTQEGADESPFASLSAPETENELLLEDVAHTCRPGEGPPAAPGGARPVIHQSTAAVRSRNATVGHAQQLLNRFLEQLRGATMACADTRPAAVEYIASLHQQLKRNGQDPLVVDCRFGPSTDLATKMFQACHGLLRDGKIGPRTWPLLERLADTAPVPPGPVPPPPTPSPTVAIREDVWTLSRQDPWHPTIRFYAAAVGAMKALGTRLDSPDPRSWGFLANIHNEQCEHGSFHFLSWHRIYLHHFEKVAREAVVRLGGPATWALPYWNYNAGNRDDSRSLPPAFREPMLPDGRTANPLFEPQRGASFNDRARPTLLAANNIELTALDELAFTTPVRGGFGGRTPAGANDFGDPGQLELEPHNLVHSMIGRVMGDPATAGLDPIFWLHHANIDRLWETWLARGRGRANPTDARWTTRSWTMGNGAARTQMRTSEVLNSSAGPLSYRYTVLEDPAPASREAELESVAELEHEARPPEVVGATPRPLAIGSQLSVANVSIARPTGPMAEMADESGPKPGTKVHLRLENVTATRVGAEVVDVFLNVPDPTRARDFPEHRVGAVPMFGVVRASKRDARHSGSGVSTTFDITRLVQRLREKGQWDPAQLRVAFVPVADADGRVPDGDVAVGRVSLFLS